MIYFQVLHFMRESFPTGPLRSWSTHSHEDEMSASTQVWNANVKTNHIFAPGYLESSRGGCGG